MTDTEFQKVILEKLTSLEWRFDWLESKVDAINSKLDSVSDELTEFKSNQEAFNQNQLEFNQNQVEFNNAIWNMSTQSFQAINEVRNEVLPPWKARKSV